MCGGNNTYEKERTSVASSLRTKSRTDFSLTLSPCFCAPDAESSGETLRFLVSVSASNSPASGELFLLYPSLGRLLQIRFARVAMEKLNTKKTKQTRRGMFLKIELLWGHESSKCTRWFRLWKRHQCGNR